MHARFALIHRIVVTALLATAGGQVWAATVTRNEAVMPAELCQPALPAYDGQIRKRPIAIQNEGSANAFVTCAMRGTFAARAINSTILVSVINNGQAAVPISCSLVDGRDLALSAPVVLTKTVSVAPRGHNLIYWQVADNGGSKYTYPAISCNLPPSTGINLTIREYDYAE